MEKYFIWVFQFDIYAVCEVYDHNGRRLTHFCWACVVAVAAVLYVMFNLFSIAFWINQLSRAAICVIRIVLNALLVI